MELLLEKNSRECKRYATIGLMSNITDGKEFFVGVIEDVSAHGFRLSQVPKIFDDTTDKCYSMVSCPKREYTFALHPRWVRITHNGMYKMIGFEIENPPASWNGFVESIREDMDPFGVLMPERTIVV